MDRPEEQLRLLEQQLLDPVVRRDGDRVSRLLADDFVEFGTSGRVFRKGDILKELASEAAATLTLRDFHARELAPGVFLVTYVALRRAAEDATVSSLRSSIWSRQSGEWRMLFHQGTKIC